mgnify:CR=1 FL=1
MQSGINYTKRQASESAGFGVGASSIPRSRESKTKSFARLNDKTFDALVSELVKLIQREK